MVDRTTRDPIGSTGLLLTEFDEVRRWLLTEVNWVFRGNIKKERERERERERENIINDAQQWRENASADSQRRRRRRRTASSPSTFGFVFFYSKSKHLGRSKSSLISCCGCGVSKVRPYQLIRFSQVDYFAQKWISLECSGSFSGFNLVVPLFT